MTGYERLRGVLVARRKELELSQRTLAILMGTRQSNVSELESGQTSDPHIGTVLRWAFALDMTLFLQPWRPGDTGREKSILREIGEAESVLAEALGYTFEEEYGWATGDHTVVSLAMEVRSRGVNPPKGKGNGNGIE